jgi:hypothetical protein
VSTRTFGHSGEAQPIELALHLACACKINKGQMGLRLEMRGFHPFLGSLKLKDHLPGLVIEVFLEFIDGIRQLLH